MAWARAGDGSREGWASASTLLYWHLPVCILHTRQEHMVLFWVCAAQVVATAQHCNMCWRQQQLDAAFMGISRGAAGRSPVDVASLQDCRVSGRYGCLDGSMHCTGL